MHVKPNQVRPGTTQKLKGVAEVISCQHQAKYASRCSCPTFCFHISSKILYLLQRDLKHAADHFSSLPPTLNYFPRRDLLVEAVFLAAVIPSQVAKRQEKRYQMLGGSAEVVPLFRPVQSSNAFQSGWIASVCCPVSLSAFGASMKVSTRSMWEIGRSARRDHIKRSRKSREAEFTVSQAGLD